MSRPAKVLVRNGDLVLPSGTVRGDVLVEAGTIRAIGLDLPALDSGTELDASGCFVVPGGVDPHVHTGIALGEYTTADDFGDCTRAAALGGTTTVVDFAKPATPDASPLETFLERRNLIGADAHVDVNLHATLTRVDQENVFYGGALVLAVTLSQLARRREARAAAG